MTSKFRITTHEEISLGDEKMESILDQYGKELDSFAMTTKMNTELKRLLRRLYFSAYNEGTQFIANEIKVLQADVERISRLAGKKE